MGTTIDHTGQRFGMLRVMRMSETRLYSQRAFECLCDCGKTSLVCGASLRRGATQSCGCQTVHLGNVYAQTHGLYYSKLHPTWRSMKERCLNPNCKHYKFYGGRGVTVCERWLEFEPFYRDNIDRYVPGCTLDRIDNDGPYTLENTRWSTATRQARNRRNTSWITYKGETKSRADWADDLGIKYITLCKRIDAGWPLEDCFFRPVRDYFPR